MPEPTARRSLRTRAGFAILAALTAVAGQIVAGGPARALIQTRPPLGYIVDSGAMDLGDIEVFDPQTNTVLSTIHTFPNPGGLALTPDGTTLYTVGDTGRIVAIDTGSLQVRATLPIGSPVFAVDASGTSLYASTSTGLTAFDTHTNAATATVPISGGVTGIAVDPAGHQLYVTVQSGPVSVVDTATNTVTATITAVTDPSTVVFNGDGSRAYITDTADENITVLNTATSAVVATIPVGHPLDDIAVTPDGAKVYGTDTFGRTIVVVNVASGAVSTIAATINPERLTINAAGTKAYVVEQGMNSVSVVDTATDTITATIPAGVNAQYVALYNGPSGQCPCSVFSPFSAPSTADSGDPYGVVLGVKVSPSAAGWIDGVRFYKSAANTGTHTGALWTSDGSLMATGTFTGESPSGWQTLMFAHPVPVKEGSTYVASYYAPNGHYAYDTGYFVNGPAGQAPITASAAGADGNGVYTYNGASAFPSYSYNAANYWVDVVFDDHGVPTTPPTVTDTSPKSGATGVSATGAVTATFSAPVDPGSVHFTLTDAAGGQVPGTVSTSAGNTVATFMPGTQLPAGTVFTASVQASDGWGTAMSGPETWNFTTSTTPPAYTCPCSLFGANTTPTDSTDPNSVELGVRFTPGVNGTVTGIRFYKGTLNTGTHTGTLWSSDGAPLATGTFTDESASGWQTLTFATPVAVTAGTTYVASYHAPIGRYSYTTGYFTYPHQNFPLTALASTGSQGNGTYAYGSSTTFPGSGSAGTNYWVDVVFANS